MYKQSMSQTRRLQEREQQDGWLPLGRPTSRGDSTSKSWPLWPLLAYHSSLGAHPLQSVDVHASLHSGHVQASPLLWSRARPLGSRACVPSTLVTCMCPLRLRPSNDPVNSGHPHAPSPLQVTCTYPLLRPRARRSCVGILISRFTWTHPEKLKYS